MIRLVWDPAAPADVQTAKEACRLYRKHGFVARKPDGRKVAKFQARAGELHFTRIPTAFELILKDEDEDEQECTDGDE